MNLGSIIKHYRKHIKCVNQAEMAAETGLSASSISFIENNQKMPTQKNLEAICSYLDLPVPLLYILSIEATDVPYECVEKYDALWPQVEQLVIHIFQKPGSQEPDPAPGPTENANISR